MSASPTPDRIPIGLRGKHRPSLLPSAPDHLVQGVPRFHEQIPQRSLGKSAPVTSGHDSDGSGWRSSGEKRALCGAAATAARTLDDANGRIGCDLSYQSLPGDADLRQSASMSAIGEMSESGEAPISDDVGRGSARAGAPWSSGAGGGSSRRQPQVDIYAEPSDMVPEGFGRAPSNHGGGRGGYGEEMEEEELTLHSPM